MREAGALLRRAEAAYESAVRDPSSQAPTTGLAAEARDAGAFEALVVALRAEAWCARHALDAEQAKRLLDEAVRVAGRHRLDDRLVQVLATRAAVNQELGRPGAARRDLDRARAHAGRTASADLGLQRAVLDHNEGRLRQAAVLYEQLLDDPSTPPDIRVKAANNLALIESHHGDHTSALARLDAVTGVAAELGPALVAIVAAEQGLCDRAVQLAGGGAAAARRGCLQPAPRGRPFAGRALSRAQRRPGGPAAAAECDPDGHLVGARRVRRARRLARPAHR